VRLFGLIEFAINIGGAQTAKSPHVCPSVANDTNTNVARWSDERL